MKFPGTVAKLVFTLVSAATLSSAAFAADSQIEAERRLPQTVLEVIDHNPVLGTLRQALQVSGLDTVLRTSDNLTVFAPTDRAFKALPPGTLDKLLADKAALSDVLKYHVLARKYLAAGFINQISASRKFETVNGTKLTVSVPGSNANETIRINGYEVLSADLEAANGVVHVIDGVLVPPAAAAE